MLTATHTHCGPAHLAVAWHEELIGGIADALTATIAEAMESVQPARLLRVEVDIPGIAANRRHPDGPDDSTARVLIALPAIGGNLHGAMATIVNFACHPTILGPVTRLYSADFPGVARRGIEALCGGVALYLQGCASDVGPTFSERTPAECRRTGAIVGAAVSRCALEAARKWDEPRVENLRLAQEVRAFLFQGKLEPVVHVREASYTGKVAVSKCTARSS
jgi:neutral ceramidase